DRPCSLRDSDLPDPPEHALTSDRRCIHANAVSCSNACCHQDLFSRGTAAISGPGELTFHS
ncbi:MAG: hypothetical protein AAGG48_32290, partial [Planctomycetota bacterium]